MKILSTIYCDVCGDYFDVIRPTDLQFMSDYGWLEVFDGYLCPKCARDFDPMYS